MYDFNNDWVPVVRGCLDINDPNYNANAIYHVPQYDCFDYAANGGDGFYVSDCINGKLIHIKNTGEVTELLDLPKGSADHEVITKKGLIFIPLMMDNKLLSYTVSD